MSIHIKEIHITMLLLYCLAPVTLLGSLAGCNQEAEPRREPAQEGTQGTTPALEGTGAVLHIHLQEGFSGDTVVVNIEGREVFRKMGVQTKLLLGYADMFDVQVPAEPVNVEIVVPSKNISEVVVVDHVVEMPYLGLSIENGNIKSIHQKEPFMYG